MYGTGQVPPILLTLLWSNSPFRGLFFSPTSEPQTRALTRQSSKKHVKFQIQFNNLDWICSLNCAFAEHIV